MQYTVERTAVDQAARATELVASDATGVERVCEIPALDCTFRISPEMLGSNRLADVLSKYRIGELDRVLPTPDSLDSRTWMQQWGEIGKDGSDSLLDGRSKRLVRPLHLAATVAVADGLGQLSRLLGPLGSGDIAEELSIFANRMERCYAVALRTLQGAARANLALCRVPYSDMEQALILESVEVIADHARWSGTGIEDAYDAACALGESLDGVVEKTAEQAYATVVERLYNGLEVLWQLVDERRQAMPSGDLNGYTDSKVRPLVMLHKALTDSAVLGRVPVQYRGVMIWSDEIDEAVVQQAEIFKRCCKLLAQQRALDLIGITADPQIDAHFQKRLKNCYADLAWSKKSLLATLKLFDASEEAISRVERSVCVIEISMDHFVSLSAGVTGRMRRAGFRLPH